MFYLIEFVSDLKKYILDISSLTNIIKIFPYYSIRETFPGLFLKAISLNVI